MRKLSVKLILSFAAFLTANLWLIGKGSAKGAADFLVSPAVEETILFILLQIIVILIYYIRPLTIRKSRIIYWLISEAFVAITFFFWGIFIVGPPSGRPSYRYPQHPHSAGGAGGMRPNHHY